VIGQEDFRASNMIGVDSAEHDPARAAIGQARPEPTNHGMACDFTSFIPCVRYGAHTIKCQAKPGFVCSMSGKARHCMFNVRQSQGLCVQ
jgi:hypothetical protein